MEAKWNNRRFDRQVQVDSDKVTGQRIDSKMDDLPSHQTKMILADASSKLSADLECQANFKGKYRSQYRSNNIMETQMTLQMMFMAQSGAQCKVLMQGSDDSVLPKLELIDRFNINISFKMSQR
jgi:hypothetical protein